MNQILDYNTDNRGSKKPSGSDKVVRLFAIIIIIFAICLIGSGAYKYIIRKNASKPTDVAKPVIEVTQDGSTAVIKVTHTKALEKLRKGRTKAQLSPHNLFYLILVEIGKTDKDVRDIMGISQEALRTLRFRTKREDLQH